MLENKVIQKYRFQYLKLSLDLAILSYLIIYLLNIFVESYQHNQLIFHTFSILVFLGLRLSFHRLPMLIAWLLIVLGFLNLSLTILKSGPDINHEGFIVLPVLILASVFILGIRPGLIIYFISVLFTGSIWFYAYDSEMFSPHHHNLFLTRIVALTLTLVASYYFDALSTRCLNEISKSRKIMEQNERLSSLGMMAGGIAHEISNPLAISKGSLAIIQQEKLTPQKKAHWLEKMDHALQRIEEIVASIRMFSNNHNDQKILPIDLHHVFSEVFSEVQDRACRLEIQIEAHPSSRPIVCNHFHLSAILKTCIENSLDAIEKHGPSRNGKVKVIQYEGMDSRQLHIVDNASLPPDTTLDHVFDPFYTTKDIGKGMGLNLTLVHSIIALYGWSIEANRDKEVTTFTISMTEKDASEMIPLAG
ncbi:sensor histidine kinase [Pseudobacteriovorax antillogorgiicola]|uniref:histidine kinase n=1 Tax=Pseudobacteriovorax antillogorgiicola TaxID=1513793 RepID=A0A1Y6CR88_9BACT|nr:HAMP domain-containing sensor histidine kinase [Pseudobacteriovorax antillogorgiicola]TCS46156.1 signal transduction histidine kinase [Pseudobacteriovorax antillogorgiicola]SMF69851.1 Signal transduction histidine kinase [Pseudobacteriovorax antillogorgiicola]